LSLLAFDRPYYSRYRSVAGVDEAGRGPLAGPVVAAAVIFASPVSIPGLNDSKKVPAARRAQLFDTIHATAVAVGVGVADVQEIDTLNIFHASVLAMRRAIENLPTIPDYVLVDGRRLKTLPYTHEGVVGGDGKSAAIAAASIIAKVTRDRFMESLHDQYPQYGFNQHKGYGTAQHLRCLSQHGPSPVHRRSFGPVKNISE